MEARLLPSKKGQRRGAYVVRVGVRHVVQNHRLG